MQFVAALPRYPKLSLCHFHKMRGRVGDPINSILFTRNQMSVLFNSLLGFRSVRRLVPKLERTVQPTRKTILGEDFLEFPFLLEVLGTMVYISAHFHPSHAMLHDDISRCCSYSNPLPLILTCWLRQLNQCFDNHFGSTRNELEPRFNTDALPCLINLFKALCSIKKGLCMYPRKISSRFRTLFGRLSGPVILSRTNNAGLPEPLNLYGQLLPPTLRRVVFFC